MKNSFSGYHPVVNFAYFVCVITFAMIFMHPICLFISFSVAFIYSVKLKGKKALKFNLIFLLPMLIFTAIINPIFNHEGVTIIRYLPSGNQLTLESIIYGFAAATMLATVICWFSCYNEIMTTDKFVYLFGRVIPSLSLILSMIFRFVPRFKEQIINVSNAQKCIGKDFSNGNVISRAKNGIAILSIMMTWALENAIDTADSMKSRGYGLPRRSAFSIYHFDNRDKKALFTICILSIFIVVGSLFGGFEFRYFPSIKGDFFNPITIALSIGYTILCAIPLIINEKEEKRWQFIQSKI